jgi:hypothetical protein
LGEKHHRREEAGKKRQVVMGNMKLSKATFANAVPGVHLQLWAIGRAENNQEDGPQVTED